LHIAARVHELNIHLRGRRKALRDDGERQRRILVEHLRPTRRRVPRADLQAAPTPRLLPGIEAGEFEPPLVFGLSE
jgi:hypothetical protein